MTVKDQIDRLLNMFVGCTFDELNSLDPYQLRVFEDKVRKNRDAQINGVCADIQYRGNPFVASKSGKRGITSSACTSEYEKYASIN